MVVEKPGKLPYASSMSVDSQVVPIKVYTYTQSNEWHVDDSTVQLEGFSYMSQRNRINGYTDIIHSSYFPKSSITGDLEIGFPNAGFRGRIDGHALYLWGLPDDIVSTSLGLTNGLTAQLREMHTPFQARALKHMTPTLETKVNIPLFLIELRDFPKLFRYGKDLVQYVTQLGRRSTLSMREISRLVAEGHLTWSFGLSPFIRDLENITAVLFKLSNTVRRFLDEAQSLELIRRHRTSVPGSLYKDLFTFEPAIYQCPFPDTITGLSPVVSVKMEPTFEPQIHSRLHEGTLVHSMSYDYGMQSLVDIDNVLLGCFKMLGVEPRASLLWELIPFSFVVDWFLDVQSKIERLDFDSIAAVLNVHMATESLRLRMTYSPDWGTLRTLGGEDFTVFSTPNAVSCQSAQFYHRYFIDLDPEQLTSRLPEGLTLERAALSASLIRKLFFK